MPMPSRPGRAQSALHIARNRLLYDFFPGRPSAELFPLKTWRRLLQGNLSHGGAVGLTQYGEPAGLPALRTAIANHLVAARGIVADPSRIVIVSGIQEGLTLLARLFLARGALSVVEDPCYHGAALAFEAAGAEVASVAVDQDGLIPDYLPQRAASLLYATPSHQYPTGATLSAARRNEVIEWARRYGCYIIEDDYDCDIRYQGSHLPPLAALAPDCAVYMGTFSKSLGAGLRLGYMVVPEHIADAVRSEKCLLNNGNPWLEQATLADFMHNGSYAAHLLRVRSHYKDNRDCLIAALRRNFGDVMIDGDSGGLHVLWHLPPGIPDAVTVEAIALRARIGVYSLSSARVHFRRQTALTSRAIILGYAALSPKQIEKGIARLSDVIDDAIDDPATDMNALFSDQFAVAAAAPAGQARSGSTTSAATGSTQPVTASCNLRKDHRTTRWRTNARSEEHLPLSDQGIERTAADPRRIAGEAAVSARSRLCPGAAWRALRHHSSAMGQEGTVRDADARGSVGPGPDHAGCRDAAPDDHAGRPSARGRRSPRRSGAGQSRGNRSGNWFRHFAARRCWSVRPTGISWTSRTM